MSPKPAIDDPAARFRALADFIGLTEQDLKLIRLARRFIGPMLPALTEDIAAKLLGDPDTRRHFEHDGPAHPERVGRHLRRYVEGLLSLAITEDLPAWLAAVGPAHGPHRGDPRVQVPQDQLDAMLGYIADRITAAIGEAELPFERRLAAIRAFNKLLWVQNAMMRGAQPGAASAATSSGPSRADKA